MIVKRFFFLLMLLILSAAFSSAFSQNVDYVYNEKEHLLKIDS
jgi:hypothetical protein